MKSGTYRVRDYLVRIGDSIIQMTGYEEQEAIEWLQGNERVTLLEVSDEYEIKI